MLNLGGKSTKIHVQITFINCAHLEKGDTSKAMTHDKQFHPMQNQGVLGLRFGWL